MPITYDDPVVTYDSLEYTYDGIIYIMGGVRESIRLLHVKDTAPVRSLYVND